MLRYKYIIVKELSEDFVKEWKKLWDNATNQNYYNSYEWFLICLEVYKIDNFKIFCIYRGNELCVVFPTIVSSDYFIKSISSPGGKFIGRSSLLLKNYDKQLLKCLFKNILSFYNLHITELNEETVSKIIKMYSGSFASIISVNPYKVLNEDPFENVDKRQKRKILQVIRTHKDKFTYKSYSYKSDIDLNAELKKIFEIEQNSYKKTKSHDIFSSEENRNLYSAFIKFTPRLIRFDFLYYENKPIAYFFGLFERNTYLAIHTAYLDKYRDVNPGKVLLYFMIADLKNSGFNKLDLGMGLSRLKEYFTNDHYFLYDVYLTNNIVYKYWWRIINSLRRLKIKLIHVEYYNDYLHLFKEYKPY